LKFTPEKGTEKVVFTFYFFPGEFTDNSCNLFDI
jgi:hypothetical protein